MKFELYFPESRNTPTGSRPEALMRPFCKRNLFGWGLNLLGLLYDTLMGHLCDGRFFHLKIIRGLKVGENNSSPKTFMVVSIRS